MKQMPAIMLFWLLVAALHAAPAAGQDQIFFVVRHAERADAGASHAPAPNQPPSMMGTDPALSPAGHARAKRLADLLRDAGVGRIITTEYLRTKETAAPLAERLNLHPVTAPDNVGALIDTLRTERRTTLVVGHSNTVPQIVKGLGVPTEVTLGEQDYDDIFIVVRHPSGAATLIRMKY